MVAGLIILASSGVSLWRALRAARRHGSAVSGYALGEAEQLGQIAQKLNDHGFALQHSASELLPKLRAVSEILQRPLLAAAIPWVLRRLFARPLRKHG